MRSPAWIGFIARRYFLAKRKQRSVASSVLSVAGLALGAATLIVVIAVMNGLQSGFIQSIMEISSYHVRLEPKPGFEAGILSSMRADPRVKAAIEFMDIQVLVKSSFGATESMNLRAMSDDAFSEDEGLRETLGIEQGDFEPLKAGNIILGSELVSSLGLATGDTVEIVSIEVDAEEGLKPSSHSFTLAGSFYSGFYEYDRSWALCSLETASALSANEGATAIIGVKLKKQNAESSFMSSVKKDNADSLVEAVSWREFNRVFFGALRVEKTVIMLVICLITLVVAVNIFHSLRRSVYERHEEIGLLRALGASPRDIQWIFIFEGCIIGLLGALIGLMLGLGIAFNVNQIFSVAEGAVNLILSAIRAIVNPLTSDETAFTIFSPAYFYLQEVPVKVYFPEALFSFLFAFLSSGFSAFFASKAISRFHPQEILRYE